MPSERRRIQLINAITMYNARGTASTQSTISTQIPTNGKRLAKFNFVLFASMVTLATTKINEKKKATTLVEALYRTLFVFSIKLIVHFALIILSI